MYITLFYLFVLAIFTSALGGFLFYKVCYKFLKLSKSLTYILGCVICVILSYPITKLLLFGGIWYFHLPIAGLAVVLYFLFLKMGNKYAEET